MSTTDDASPDTDTTPDEVAQLRDEIAYLRLELAQAKQRITELEATIDETGSATSLPPAASDWRDARVLEALDPGDVLSLKQFRTLVESRTDIRDDEKITERVRRLAETDAFERLDPGWRYRGAGGDR
ncbi:MAG: hypothetical protein ACOCY1_06255 [Halovenus sp.]